MTFLLDVNVLIAMLDEDHVDYARAVEWFGNEGRSSWATCPITQNGAVRILGHPSYPGGHGDCSLVARTLSSFCDLPGHIFWPDDLDLLNSPHILIDSLPKSRHLTDTYLLALAASQNGMLATFDRKLSALAVTGGAEALHVIC